MRTANTPAFSSGRSIMAAQSPAAKISGSVSLCKVSRTRMKPWSSSASPVSRSQAAPPAWVTQTISSASSTSPVRVRRRPAATCDDFGAAMHRDAALGQHLARRPARTAALCVGRMLRVGGKEMAAQFVRVAAQRRQFAAQAVLHRQRQLDTAGAGADHGDGRRPGVAANALEQGQPAFVEAADRLDRHGVLGRAGDVRRAAASNRC